MTPVKACSICGAAIVGFGNDAWPVNDAAVATNAMRSASFQRCGCGSATPSGKAATAGGFK